MILERSDVGKTYRVRMAADVKAYSVSKKLLIEEGTILEAEVKVNSAGNRYFEDKRGYSFWAHFCELAERELHVPATTDGDIW